MTIISVLISCKSKEANKYFDIKENLNDFINSKETDINILMKDADELKNDIKVYISDFKESEYFNEISNLDKSFDNTANEKLLNVYVTNIDSLAHQDFTDYDAKLERIDVVLNDGNSLRLRFSEIKFKDKLDDALEILQKKRRICEKEKTEYSIIIKSYRKEYSPEEADIEIKTINDFLYTFSNSIKETEMKNRIDDLIFVKIELQSKSKIANIVTLNAVIDTCTMLKREIKNPKIIEKANNEIENLNDLRSKIFKREFKDKQKEIDELMAESAKKFLNENIHEFCKKIISSKLTDSNLKEYSNKTIYGKTFQFQSKCGFGCSKTCETIISVTATIYGDENSGVTFEIIPELVSDKNID